MGDFAEVDVQCPYYEYNTKTDIICEGHVETAATCSIRFRTIAARKGYMKRFCNGKYGLCPHCRALDQKYE